MFTYLQHSDPTVPYYREVCLIVTRMPVCPTDNLQGAWTFARGALATIDRPVFGWIGRFFWHGVRRCH